MDSEKMKKLRDGIDRHFLDILENGEVRVSELGEVKRVPPSVEALEAAHAWYKDRLAEQADHTANV